MCIGVPRCASVCAICASHHVWIACKYVVCVSVSVHVRRIRSVLLHCMPACVALGVRICTSVSTRMYARVRVMLRACACMCLGVLATASVSKIRGACAGVWVCMSACACSARRHACVQVRTQVGICGGCMCAGACKQASKHINRRVHPRVMCMAAGLWLVCTTQSRAVELAGLARILAHGFATLSDKSCTLTCAAVNPQR